MSKYPTQKEYEVPLSNRMLFNARNFIAGRMHRIKFNVSLWFRVQARRRRAAAIDPLWKETWWCLERRYTMLAKKYTKLELKYLKQKDIIRRLKNGKHRT
tara:strand:+ start:2686 stop:2985 length:300 start_codon:yes stop_codon:yes gene_type:complete